MKSLKKTKKINNMKSMILHEIKPISMPDMSFYAQLFFYQADQDRKNRLLKLCYDKLKNDNNSNKTAS